MMFYTWVELFADGDVFPDKPSVFPDPECHGDAERGAFWVSISQSKQIGEQQLRHRCRLSKHIRLVLLVQTAMPRRTVFKSFKKKKNRSAERPVKSGVRERDFHPEPRMSLNVTPRSSSGRCHSKASRVSGPSHSSRSSRSSSSPRLACTWTQLSPGRAARSRPTADAKQAASARTRWSWSFRRWRPVPINLGGQQAVK